MRNLFSRELSLVGFIDHILFYSEDTGGVYLDFQEHREHLRRHFYPLQNAKLSTLVSPDTVVLVSGKWDGKTQPQFSRKPTPNFLFPEV